MVKDFIIVNLDNGEPESLNKVLKLFQGLTGKFILEISKAGKRSNPQNRYYWGLVVPVIQKGLYDLGHDLTKEETHEFLKAKFNSEELINETTGEVLPIPRSTTRLNKTDFSTYLEKIQQFASEFLNIFIPSPGAQTKVWE